MMDIRTLRIEARLLKTIDEIRSKEIDIKYFAQILSTTKNELRGYCDNAYTYEQELIIVIDNLDEILTDEIYLSSCSSETGYEVDESLFQDKDNEELKRRYKDDINDLEKLIIRGSEDGAPVTEEERAEWWKMQKEREREEFYKLNGYYEDEEQ